MSMTWPIVWIAIGAIVLAGGAALTQYGWNAAGDAQERRAMVRTVSEANTWNRIALEQWENVQAAGADTLAVNPRVAVAEVAALDAALASGLFLHQRFASFRDTLRSTRDALIQYNSAASRQFASRRQTVEFGQEALRLTRNLQALITQNRVETR